MLLLAFETSCDETSAAVVREGCVLSSVVSSQVRLHSEYGGVVPELATREHLRNLLPVAFAALKQAHVQPGDVDAIAATQGPGLPNALMIGLKAAQAAAFALGKPFLGINHHEAHLYSAWVTGDPPRADFDSFKPSVSLIVSGGHTMLVFVEAELRHRVLGSTLDDAAGECFDKVGKLLGLPYPAGPEIDRLAQHGNPRTFNFPRPMMTDGSDDFSFSGLKTSVRYFLQKHPALTRDILGLQPPRGETPGRGSCAMTSVLCDLCASVQAAIVDVLVAKTVRAAKRLGVRCVTASGGVTCNSELRRRLNSSCRSARFTLRLAEKSLCTDNAAMIAILAERKLNNGAPPTSPDAEIEPGWVLR